MLSLITNSLSKSLKSLNSLKWTPLNNTLHSYPQFNYQYDLFVIGGGSAGWSASRQASQLKRKIGMADFIVPSPKGTTWGVGGTCVNVGCIPKKMMHYAAELHMNLKKLPLIGYPHKLPSNPKHDWTTMVENIQNHIRSMNFLYSSMFEDKNIHYYNKLAKFKDAHTLELTDVKGEKELVTADKILIATGGRPKYNNIPGEKENCITSDDWFSLSKPPGKTLIIGASYIALECGGVLRSLGYDTTIMVRSIWWRGFDRKMVGLIGTNWSHLGVKFINTSIPIEYIKQSNGNIKVKYLNTKTNETSMSEEYNTVLIAMGRTPNTSSLNLQNIGVKVSNTGKIVTDNYDTTSIPNIFSLGDCAFNRPELTPPAIMAGKLWVNRWFVKGYSKAMDYDNIATTIFTPIEYGSCGWDDESAIKKFGKGNIKVYHCEFTPPEWRFDIENETSCYMKVVVRVGDDRVVGFHVFAPNAGEITQGVAVAMKMGVRKKDFDETVGIHPTIAEEMTGWEVTTDEGSGKKGGCCG